MKATTAWYCLLVVVASACVCMASHGDAKMLGGQNAMGDDGYVTAHLVPFLDQAETMEQQGAIIDTDAELTAALLELSTSIHLEHLVVLPTPTSFSTSQLDQAEIESGIHPSSSPEAAAFYRFAREHDREYGSMAAAATAFLTFKSNMHQAAELTASSGSLTQFSATGPMADVDGATFRKLLNTKHWRGKDKGKSILIKKAGRAAGMSGRGAQKSGKTGGQSGKGAQKSGKTGGQSGKGAQKSGKTGGESGKGAQKSGKTGGESGKRAKKSGKTGGESGKGAKKSGKTGGQSGKTGGDAGKKAKKSGKTGGTGHTVVSDLHGLGPTKPTKTASAKVSKAALAAQHPMDKTFGLTPTSAATLRSVSVDKIKALMTANGMSAAEIEATFQQFRYHSQIQAPYFVDQRGVPAPASFEQTTVCGSCWAFAATMAVQRMWTVIAHYPGRISAQPLIDCVRSEDTKGCKGGTPMDGLDYLGKNYFALIGDYPELLKDGTCKKGPYPTTPKVRASSGWDMLIPACTDEKGNCGMQIRHELLVAKWLMANGNTPPIVYVDASNWQHYTGGIFDVSKCQSTMDAGNHIVTIVGFGTELTTGLPYWVLENMWSVKWGEKGRIRLPMGMNACGMMNFMIYPKPPASFVLTDQVAITKDNGLTNQHKKANGTSILSNAQKIIDDSKKYKETKTYTADEWIAQVMKQDAAAKAGTLDKSDPRYIPDKYDSGGIIIDGEKPLTAKQSARRVEDFERQHIAATNAAMGAQRPKKSKRKQAAGTLQPTATPPAASPQL